MSADYYSCDFNNLQKTSRYAVEFVGAYFQINSIFCAREMSGKDRLAIFPSRG